MCLCTALAVSHRLSCKWAGAALSGNVLTYRVADEERPREAVNRDGTSSIPAPAAFDAYSFPGFVPSSFRKNATMEQGDPALGPAIAHAEEVAKILRENVVQGKRVDKEGEERYSEF